jgi:hypothetical protein
MVVIAAALFDVSGKREEQDLHSRRLDARKDL